jgi:hypothetical protein
MAAGAAADFAGIKLPVEKAALPAFVFVIGGPLMDAVHP